MVSDVENSATAGSYGHIVAHRPHNEGLHGGKQINVYILMGRSLYLWSKVSHPNASHEAQPLAERLGLVERKHGLSHLAAVTDRNIRHEFHSSCHDCITLTSSN